ncbi:hypothetical protein [Aquirufa lenticrescens]|uniref:hypothetical protein n=1 Tax=Aquirufa lenticrescens TaxID=2696560 RepID=UPI001CAA5C85|nr:hypothetical protein [Aquirufa lenticrescens]UAJ14355.1 hypothetical protein G9X62_07190 [Aquirufa lenticrescens]
MIDLTFDRTIDPFEWLPGLDAAPDFIPDAEYTDLLQRCDAAYADILSGEVLNYRMVELKAVVNQYTELFHEVEKELKYYEGFDRFFYLFDAVFTAYLFMDQEGWNAFFALDDYSKFDMSEERNLTNWLFSYQALNEKIAEHLFYNSDCDCNSQEYYRISHLGIHIHKEDLTKIFEFSTLYTEHYAQLLKQYMDITWEDFFSYTEEDQMYYLRDNLFYYILKSRNKNWSPIFDLS